MADTKVTALTANTTPLNTDIMYIVDDPGGTPLGQKITLANLFNLVGASGLDGASPIQMSMKSTNDGTWTDEAIMAQLLFISADNSGSAGNRGGIKCYADATSGADFGMSFWTTTNGNTGFQEQMRIDHQGYLGIGTITPTQYLHVAGNIAFTRVTAPTAPTGVQGSGTGLDAGGYKYKIAYYTTNTATPTEAGTASATITVTANKSIDLTIPTSSDSKVVGRKIYRTLAGGSVYYFVANVTNNTATTYTDTTPDASISSNVRAPAYNITGGSFYVGSTLVGNIFTSSTFFGSSAGLNLQDGQENTAFGSSAGLYLKTGSYNTFVGHRCGQGNISDQAISGDYNTGIGRQTLQNLSTGHRNCGLGMGAGFSITTGAYNILLGVDCYYGTTGNNNFMAGYHTGNLIVDGNSSDNVVLAAHGTADAVTTMNKCTMIGNEIVPSDSLTNAIAIGYGASVTASNTMMLGGTGSNKVSVVIGATSANAASVLQADSTTQGFLPPRMTTAQRDAISSPPEGLVIYNTTTSKLNVKGASAWEAITSA